jgi:hypothetical protein
MWNIYIGLKAVINISFTWSFSIIHTKSVLVMQLFRFFVQLFLVKELVIQNWIETNLIHHRWNRR